jgi:hypothetical protein
MINYNHIITNDQIYLFKHVLPRRCNTPCKDNCSDTQICPLNRRINSDLNVANIWYKSKPGSETSDVKAINLLPAFRSLHGLGTGLNSEVNFNYYLGSIKIDVERLYKSSYTANKDVLFIATNNISAISSLKLGDTIPESVFAFASIALVNNNGFLRIYYGSNSFSNKINFYDINLQNRSIRNYEKVYLSYVNDPQANTLSYTVFADDLQLSHILHTETLSSHLNANTHFYNHPEIKHVNINVSGPSFNLDIYTHYKSTKFWRVPNKSNICNKSGDVSCAKCIHTEGEPIPVCQACTNGYTFILGKCIPASQGKK